MFSFELWGHGSQLGWRKLEAKRSEAKRRETKMGKWRNEDKDRNYLKAKTVYFLKKNIWKNRSLSNVSWCLLGAGSHSDDENSLLRHLALAWRVKEMKTWRKSEKKRLEKWIFQSWTHVASCESDSRHQDFRWKNEGLVRVPWTAATWSLWMKRSWVCRIVLGFLVLGEVLTGSAEGQSIQGTTEPSKLA